MLIRFRKKVKWTTGCWHWLAAKNPLGYGVMAWKTGGGKQRATSAHRIAYVMFIGDIPAGAVIRHACDMADCVNPFHLVLGTQKENMRDMLVRGGTIHVLAWIDVKQIRKNFASGISVDNLATSYGIHRNTVMGILRNESWHDPTYKRPPALPRKKLAFHDVQQARELHKQGWKVGELAQFYEVPQSTMSEALSGATWNY